MSDLEYMSVVGHAEADLERVQDLWDQLVMLELVREGEDGDDMEELKGREQGVVKLLKIMQEARPTLESRIDDLVENIAVCELQAVGSQLRMTYR